MTLRNQILVADTPVNIISTLSLTVGETEYMQATGIGTVQFAAQTDAPTDIQLDSGNVLGPGSWVQLEITAEPIWVWSHDNGRVTLP